MEVLGKVNSVRLYKLWKNLTVGVTTVIVIMAVSELLPYYLAPVSSLLAAAFLYAYIFEARARRDSSCLIVPYGMLYSLVAYSVICVIASGVSAWGLKSLPREFVFLNDPYVPSLLINPVCCLTFIYMLSKRSRLHVCLECRLTNSVGIYDGAPQRVFSHESHFQLKNLTVMFGILSVMVWVYYLVFYVNININARDCYMFTWVTVICFVLDEVYFIARYYNLYLDLKENNGIVAPGEREDVTAKTYLRFYVICGNNVFVDAHAIDPQAPYREVIDTPFLTERAGNAISVDEVKGIIKKMTGYDGELRFFFGGSSFDGHNHGFLRYFYFLDGEADDYREMKTGGEWMDYEKIKYLYSKNPGRLSDISLSDTTRLATIMLTEKIFDEEGYRKSKIKLYNPSFDLIDVRKSNLDFQDDKWIRISFFNSDTPFYSIKRKWRRMVGGGKKKSNSWQ